MKNCRPLMIEFMGSPEAGKTTAIDSIVKSLNDLGIITSKIRESAESVPSYYPKGSLSAHFWMRLNTAKSISEQYHKNSDDVIIIDRGIYDTMFWNEIFKNKGELNKSECYVADSFFEMLHLKPDFTICLFVSPEESVFRRGGEGRIVTRAFISDFNTKLHYFTIMLKNQGTEVFELTTDKLSPEKVQTVLLNKILEFLK